VAPGWPPLFHAAGEPSPSQESGRWHRQGEGYAQYLSLTAPGAWAEFVRRSSIRDAAFLAEQRRTLWQVFVDSDAIADLSSFEQWDALGLDPRDAVGDHAPCQALADELKDAGFKGVLAPSAALPGVVNLTIFGARYERLLITRLEDWDNPDPDIWLPCALVAEATAPPDRLRAETCYLGSPHRGYREYLSATGASARAGTP